MTKPVKMNKVMDTEHSFSEHFIQFIMKHMDYPWNWYDLSQNPLITFDIVETYRDLPWNLGTLSTNPNLTLDVIEKHIKNNQESFFWTWDRLSINQNITFDFVEKYIDKPWNWKGRKYTLNINKM